MFFCRIAADTDSEYHIVEDDESLPERYVPLAEDGDEMSEDEEAGPSAFDDEEDAKIIADSKRKFLKSKGIKVNRPRADVAE